MNCIGCLVFGLLVWTGSTYGSNFHPPIYEFDDLDLLDESPKIDIPSLSNGPTVMLKEDWPSPEVFNEIGIITSLKAVDPLGSTVYVLQRGDHEWNQTTFDNNNIYQARSAGPITDGALVKIVDGKISDKFLPNIFYMPHGLSRDPGGNFWITDVGLHQVFKFSADLSSQPLLTLGEAFVPGSDQMHFCKPTDVAVASNGDFFVADGYCNNRIMKFHANGTLIMSWGEDFQDPEDNEKTTLDVPHQLALSEEQNLLCVADRENARVVCFHAGLTPETASNTGQVMFILRNQENAPIYGVAINKLENLLIALTGITDQGDPSKILIYDLDAHELITDLNSNNETGYGMAHAVTSCPSNDNQSCFLVCNTNPIRSDQMTDRRMWKYDIYAESPFPNLAH